MEVYLNPIARSMRFYGLKGNGARRGSAGKDSTRRAHGATVSEANTQVLSSLDMLCAAADAAAEAARAMMPLSEEDLRACFESCRMLEHAASVGNTAGGCAGSSQPRRRRAQGGHPGASAGVKFCRRLEFCGCTAGDPRAAHNHVEPSLSIPMGWAA